MGHYLKKEYGDKIKIIGFTDLGKAEEKEVLLENLTLFRNEKAIYQFPKNSIGKSSFLKYAPYPEGEWSNVIDFGVVINSEGPIRLYGKVVSPEVLNHRSTPVPYTLIQIAGTTKGSVANENGEFELIIKPEFINCDILFTSLGYEPTILKASQVKDEIFIFEKAELLDGVVVIPNQNNPLEIIRNLSANRIKTAPPNPFSITMYNYQDEVSNQSNEIRIRESALEYYYETVFEKMKCGCRIY